MKAFYGNDAQVGPKVDVEVEVLSKPIAEYNTDEYFELEYLWLRPSWWKTRSWWKAPMSRKKVGERIRAKLGLEAIVIEKKGVLGRLFGG